MNVSLSVIDYKVTTVFLISVITYKQFLLTFSVPILVYFLHTNYYPMK